MFIIYFLQQNAFSIYRIIKYQKQQNKKMTESRKQAVRPFSRLEFNNIQTIAPQKLCVAGIPTKNISSSKPFPQLQINVQDKENYAKSNAFKQLKPPNLCNQLAQQHLKRRKIKSQIANVVNSLDTKLKEANKIQNNQAQPGHQEKLSISYCQVLIKQNSQAKVQKSPKKVCLVDERQNKVKKIRERLETLSPQNDYEEQKKRYRIGEKALLPYCLNILKKKVQQRTWHQ